VVKLGICLVGPGAIGATHVRAQAPLGLTDNRWVVGPTADAAKRFAGEWGFAHATADLDAALADAAVDVVLIASPNPLHAEQALRALAAGKHVIVEIPVAMSADDATEVAEQAAAAGRRALVCQTMRSFPAIRTLRDRVRAGTLTISQILSYTATPRRNNENWIGGTREWVDNALWHHSCHYLDASLWVLGATEAHAVWAQFGRPNPRFGMRMDVSVTLKTADDVLVSHGSTYNVAHSSSQMRFFADQGMFTVERTRLVDEHGNECSPATEWTDLGAQDRAMLTSILEGSPSDFEVASVLPTMRLLDKAQAYEPDAREHEMQGS
jgi:2-hydroxy-4-carboxymuconate semialdehyde hemiacetal dehydrogenase